ncbi:MAG: RecX family transcriptional regulator [Muribaculaceae bacterium]|nr:RecX family transcriptional regulator [Muribaculaceae bacterium]
MKKPVDPQDALARMESRCSMAEYCSYEIEMRLRRMGLSTLQIAKIMERLHDGKFVDDGRYAAAFVRDKYRFSAWGRYKIRMALIAKRIPKHIIDEALQEIEQKEYVRVAFRAIAAKLRLLPADADRIELRQKLLRFGLSRGYESSLVIKILQSDRLWR